MPPRLHARVAALSAACLMLAAPASAIAAPLSGEASGGAGLGGSTGATGSTATAQATPSGPVSAQGNGFTLTTSASTTLKSALDFSGSVSSADTGDQLAIQRESARGAWQTVTETAVGSGGAFNSTWTANTSGLIGFRAALQGPAGTAQAASVQPAAASPTVAVTIYSTSIATIYGPGFYGHRTACGRKLTATMLGVASRTLKCGTKVSISYDGQSIVVPVIDRGPYANNATWDLTEATAAALGDADTETVGAAVL